MAKKWKQILAAGMTAGLLMACSSQSVFAQSDGLIDAILDEEEGADEITSEETTEDFAEDTSYSLLRGTNLNFGSVKIKKIASNEIAIYGLTQCHKKCSKVYLYLYLERKVNGSYGTYKYWEFTGNNTSACGFSIGFERIVMLLLERGYQIPTAKTKKAYLIEKNMPADKLIEIFRQAEEERKTGIQVNISIMKKNKKFQKDQMAAEGYTEFVEFFKR